MTESDETSPITGIYRRLFTRAWHERVKSLPQDRWLSEPLQADDAESFLARHVAEVLEGALRRVGETAEEGKPRRRALQSSVVDTVVEALADWVRSSDAFKTAEREDLIRDLCDAKVHLDETGGVREMQAIMAPVLGGSGRIPPPAIPVDRCDLLVNGRDEVHIGNQIEREIESADEVDILCAFLRVSGVRFVESALRRLRDRGGKARIITTTYCEATERAALDRLERAGATIKVSYDVRRTRLHAKAWLFHRRTGFSTVFVGSANLSQSALADGIEWNVRLAEATEPDVIKKFRGTFESYWNDPEFRDYRSEEFDAAIARQSRPAAGAAIDRPFFELSPWPFQEKILDELMRERFVHNRWANLLVAATGTGKTVIAAFDYRRLRDRGIDASGALPLLFVAHRKEILEQSLAVYREVLRDHDFGELMVDGAVPSRGTHVFASVQSLESRGYEKIDREFFSVIVVDEFHHAAADTYRRLLDYFRPRVLLGLTATPERTDGESILGFFGGRIAAEYRIFEALEHGQLTPFRYFAVPDRTDLTAIAWRNGRYDVEEIERYYLQFSGRTAVVMEALDNHLGPAVQTMRALAFCVSVDHARFMAEEFKAHDLAAVAVCGNTPSEERAQALRDLRDGRLRVITCVDVFNEGVDIPEVDVILFLRPTESATVFTQQLGRGLRRAPGKTRTTVLDFVGKAHRSFRFEHRLRVILGDTVRGGLLRAVEDGFPHVPPGCYVRLEGEVSKIVLDSLKDSIENRKAARAEALRLAGPSATLSSFLAETGLSIRQLYAKHAFTDLLRDVGFETSAETPDEIKLLSAIRRRSHVDDLDRIAALERLVRGDPAPQQEGERGRRLRAMAALPLIAQLGPTNGASPEAILAAHPLVARELRELSGILRESAVIGERDSRLPAEVPLVLGARYDLREILAAFGKLTLDGPAYTPQSGVYPIHELKLYLFFVTLEKNASDYQPHTMYRDYAIARDIFHWESPSTTRLESDMGQDFIDHAARGIRPLFFIRSAQKDTHGFTMAYHFVGSATCLRHEGERPIAITWRLDRPLPAELWLRARVA